MPREFECVVVVLRIHKHIVGENKENLPGIRINSMSGGGLEEAHLHLTTFRLVLKNRYGGIYYLSVQLSRLLTLNLTKVKLATLLLWSRASGYQL